MSGRLNHISDYAVKLKVSNFASSVGNRISLHRRHCWPWLGKH